MDPKRFVGIVPGDDICQIVYMSSWNIRMYRVIRKCIITSIQTVSLTFVNISLYSRSNTFVQVVLAKRLEKRLDLTRMCIHLVLNKKPAVCRY